MQKRICVFAGSSLGSDPAFVDAAAGLGRELAARGCGLVYGGASVGLMAIVANAVLECGGDVTGVMPAFLVDKEIAHLGLSELKVVTSMHQRKDTMASLADGFIALPGGFGTIEEFFEILTWAQLGLHQKPCGLLNAGGYFDDLLRFLDAGVARHLVKPANREMVIVESDPGVLLDRFATYTARIVPKWIETELT